MLTLPEIETREKEIVDARARLMARIHNMDGALELIVLFKKDIEAKARQKADELAAAAEAEVAAKAAEAETEDQDASLAVTTCASTDNIIAMRAAADTGL